MALQFYINGNLSPDHTSRGAVRVTNYKDARIFLECEPKTFSSM